MADLRTIDFSCGLMRMSEAGLLLLVALWLSGCGYPGTAKLRELCDTEGYPRVYREVSAAGYYDDVRECDGVMEFLEDWEYAYVECEQERRSYRELIPQGIYRLVKVPESSGECDAKLLEDMRRRQYGFEKMLADGLCFSLEAIEKPEAEYGLYKEETQITHIDNIFGSRISGLHLLVKDRRSGETLVEGKSFMLFPHPRIAFSSFQTTIHCRTIDSAFEEVKGLSAVNHYINPISPGREKQDANIGRDL